MEQYYADFVSNLKSLVLELDAFYSTEGTKEFIKIFSELKFGMVIARYNKISNKCKEQLNKKDESLFQDNKFNILPGINLSEIWKKINDSQKDRIWTYLQILHLSSNFLMEYSRKSNISNKPVGLLNTSDYNKQTKPAKTQETQETQGTQETQEASKQLTFNPYEGIGVSAPLTATYDMNDLMSGPKVLPGEQSQNSSSGIASMLGMGNLLNMDELAKELKNINPEEIEQATNNIKNLLGNNVDKKTSDMLTDMLTNITDELKREPDDANNSNPIDKIVKIAESVAEKMVPKMRAENMDVSKLWKSTQQIASQCGDGNQMFNGFNPMTIINTIMNKQMNFQENMAGKTEEECLQECQNLLKSAGIPNMDPNNIKNMKNMFGPGPTQNKKNNDTRDRLKNKLAQKKQTQ